MGWRKMKLGDVLINREGRYKPNDPAIAGLKRIEKINFSGQIFLSDKGSNTDMILVKKGDLVISGINVEKGALAVYEGEQDILATIHYSSYIFNTEKIDIEFLKVFLRSPDFVQLLKEQVPGGIKTEIKPKHILPLEVNFPETTLEQRDIAKQFFEKEAKLNQLNGQIENQLTFLENLNQAILQEAVQGKLVPQDPNDEPAAELLKRIKAEKAKSGKKEKPLPPIRPEEIPFEIPESWVWCRLGEVTQFVSGNNFESTDFYKGYGVKCIKITNAGVNEIIETDDVLPFEFLEKYKQFLVFEGDLVLALTRPYISTGLKISICPKSYDKSLLNQRVAVIRAFEGISSEYVYRFLSSNIVLKKYKSMFEGQGQQPNLKKEDVTTLQLPLPPLSEQKRIVAEIEKQLAKTQELKEHVIANQQATEQLLKALLHEAFEVETTTK